MIFTYNNKRMFSKLFQHVFKDERGLLFLKSFNHQKLEESYSTKKLNLLQDIQSFLTKGYLEVYMFQKGETCQAKLSVVFLERYFVLDVVVDIRKFCQPICKFHQPRVYLKKIEKQLLFQKVVHMVL